MLNIQSRNVKIIFGILFVFIGIFLISYNYLSSIKNDLINKKNLDIIETTVILNTTLDEVNEISEEVEIYESKGIDDYIGIVDIEKLGIHRGFLSENSEYNDVKYNVMLIKGSTMPNVSNGNLILASHRGNSAVAFFDKLYQLEMNDEAKIIYQNKTYTYHLVDLYYVPRTGNISIKRNKNKTCLTLITCTRGDRHSQSVYIFELDSIN